MDNISLSDAIEQVASYSGYSVDEVREALRVSALLQEAPEFQWYTVYEKYWIPSLQTKNIKEVFDFLNIIKPISERLYYVLVQQALDPIKRDLSWRKGAQIYPQMEQIRQVWLQKLEILLDNGKTVLLVPRTDIDEYIANCIFEDMFINTPYLPQIIGAIGIIHRFQGYRKAGGKWNESHSTIAARLGHLEFLEYLDEEMPNCSYEQIVCNYAASGGHLKILKYFHAKGFPINRDSMESAAYGGKIDCIAFLREIGHEWNPMAFGTAAEAGQLECIQYLYENDCPPCEWACSAAAKGGHIACLRYLLERNFPSEGVCSAAAMKGHLDCLRLARENYPPCSWEAKTVQHAARRGCMEILKYLLEEAPGAPCPWDSLACADAVKDGHLDCLRYLHEGAPNSPCPWSLLTCNIAVTYGHLDCLKYAHERGCEWGDILITLAIRYNRSDFLAYLRANGCPEPYQDAIN